MNLESSKYEIEIQFVLIIPNIYKIWHLNTHAICIAYRQSSHKTTHTEWMVKIVEGYDEIIILDGDIIYL